MNNQGWKCPNCNKCLAPWMPECNCYKLPNTSVSTGTVTSPYVNELICPLCNQKYPNSPFYLHTCHSERAL